MPNFISVSCNHIRLVKHRDSTIRMSWCCIIWSSPPRLSNNQQCPLPDNTCHHRELAQEESKHTFTSGPEICNVVLIITMMNGEEGMRRSTTLCLQRRRWYCRTCEMQLTWAAAALILPGETYGIVCFSSLVSCAICRELSDISQKNISNLIGKPTNQE